LLRGHFLQACFSAFSADLSEIFGNRRAFHAATVASKPLRQQEEKLRPPPRENSLDKNHLSGLE
jgi:hypothetical protein